MPFRYACPSIESEPRRFRAHDTLLGHQHTAYDLHSISGLAQAAQQVLSNNIGLSRETCIQAEANCSDAEIQGAHQHDPSFNAPSYKAEECDAANAGVARDNDDAQTIDGRVSLRPLAEKAWLPVKTVLDAIHPDTAGVLRILLCRAEAENSAAMKKETALADLPKVKLEVTGLNHKTNKL
eukprot:scaffold102616_cov46-Prasinocladus_malaysianus.AAC.1